MSGQDPYDFSQQHQHEVAKAPKPAKRTKTTKEVTGARSTRLGSSDATEFKSKLSATALPSGVKSHSKVEVDALSNVHDKVPSSNTSTDCDIVKEPDDTSVTSRSAPTPGSGRVTPDGMLTTRKCPLTCTVAVETESVYLGPCEPGTSVMLEGVVWHESDTGILVINVAWRGKKYIGTLLDATIHDWAPPHFSPSTFTSHKRDGAREKSSPVKVRGRKGRGKKAVTSQSQGQGATLPSQYCSPRKWSSSTSTSPKTEDEDNKPEALEGVTSVICPEPKCNKKFRGANCKDALEYHRIHAHATVNSNPDQPTSLGKRKTSSKTSVDESVKNSKQLKKEVSEGNSQSHNNKVGQLHKSSSLMDSSPSVARKPNAPIAVLRPLVPQHLSQAAKPPSSSAASGTNRNPPVDRYSQQYYNTGTNKMTRLSGNQPHQSSTFARPTIPSVGVIPTVGTPGGRSHLTFSDISDASDQETEEMERRSQTDRPAPSEGSPQKLPVSSASSSSIEDRLFCNEELATSSPSPLPVNTITATSAVTITTAAISSRPNDKTTSTHSNDSSKTNDSNTSQTTVVTATSIVPTTGPHMLPVNSMLPSNMPAQPPLMYPYLPFIHPTGQMSPGGVRYPTSSHGGSAMYAAPYVMAYPGMQPFVQHPVTHYGPVPFPDRNPPKPPDHP